MKLCIDPEFETVNPPPTPEERAQLEANLVAERGHDAFTRSGLCPIAGIDGRAPPLGVDLWVLLGHPSLARAVFDGEVSCEDR